MEEVGELWTDYHHGYHIHFYKDGRKLIIKYDDGRDDLEIDFATHFIVDSGYLKVDVFLDNFIALYFSFKNVQLSTYKKTYSLTHEELKQFVDFLRSQGKTIANAREYIDAFLDVLRL